MKIYIDINDGFKCYTSDTSGLLEFEEPDFDGKCTKFIEGYRCKPVGYTWVDENGTVYNDSYKMISPWKNYGELYKAQLEYEVEQYKAALAEAEASYESGVNSI